MSQRYVGFDSAPFTNGDLHLGHARNYVLGDVDARFHRLIGRDVVYTTNFDVFGLPTVLEARRTGREEEAITESTRNGMVEDMRRLGLSYDTDRIRSTNDPDYVRGTQHLFLSLLADGLAEYRESLVPWCISCDTSLSEMQVEDGRCSRCDKPVETRTHRGWVILLSKLNDALYEGIDDLEGWSERSKNLLRAAMGRESDGSFRLEKWDVSRQLGWGTPVPALHCPDCGPVGVSAAILPWSPSSQLEICTECGREALPDPDQLDCFFDDAWFFASWAGGGPLDGQAPEGVDIFHAGYDTWAYLHLYRFIGRYLWSKGVLNSPEPIRRYPGHDLVIRSGEKMSKSRGNAVSVHSILEDYHPDELRFSLIATAAPDKPIHWVDERMDLGRAAVHRIRAMVEEILSLTGTRP